MANTIPPKIANFVSISADTKEEPVIAELAHQKGGQAQADTFQTKSGSSAAGVKTGALHFSANEGNLSPSSQSSMDGLLHALSGSTSTSSSNASTSTASTSTSTTTPPNTAPMNAMVDPATIPPGSQLANALAANPNLQVKSLGDGRFAAFGEFSGQLKVVDYDSSGNNNQSVDVNASTKKDHKGTSACGNGVFINFDKNGMTIDPTDKNPTASWGDANTVS
jgi:hypothetical protein